AIVRRQQNYLFHWPLLFVCGAAAALASFGAYLRGRAPRAIAVPLLSLLVAYVLYAAVFSQHVAMHPYLFDTLLATPLIVALFVVVRLRLDRGDRRHVDVDVRPAPLRAQLPGALTAQGRRDGAHPAGGTPALRSRP